MKVSAGIVVLLLATGAALFALQPQPLVRDVPRNLPWQLPDYRQAEVQWQVDDRGRIQNYVQHYFLAGVSPQMVAWFYRKLPISTVAYGGKTYPLYHLFHPSEHGRIKVLEAAHDGEPGMGRGAVIMREEWFGDYDSRGRARLSRFGDDGMLAVPQFAGYDVGEVNHRWHAEAGGTRYEVRAVIGVDWPVVGPLLNWGIRYFIFHPQMMAQWQRHQVEEVSSLQFFLPQLYAQRGRGNHFELRP